MTGCCERITVATKGTTVHTPDPWSEGKRHFSAKSSYGPEDTSQTSFEAAAPRFQDAPSPHLHVVDSVQFQKAS